jgi:hypothetical protein
VLRRLDCVLASTKVAVLAEKAAREAAGVNPDPFLLRIAKLRFVNTSPLDMKKKTISPPTSWHTSRGLPTASCAPLSILCRFLDGTFCRRQHLRLIMEFNRDLAIHEELPSCI